MTVEVQFSKDHYHLQDDMRNWCKENIGPGMWTYSTPNTWEGMNDCVWVIHSMFGSTFFAFKNDADASMFILRWE